MVLIDVSDVVSSLAAQTVTRTRTASPTISAAGHAVAGASTTATLRCVLQRPSADAIQRLPQGLQAQARWLMHTTGDVRGASESTPNGGLPVLPDAVTYGARSYIVYDITDQEAHGLYRRVILLDGGA
jgi:hypothetical protein